MNLIFIYGPPGTGKLTVAKELAKLAGYKLLHNHLAQDIVSSVFPWEHPERRRLARKFRLEMFESAAKHEINIITTFGAVGPNYNDFVDEIMKVIGTYNGNIYLVKITCSEKELFRRIGSSSRKRYGKISTIEMLKKKMVQVDYTLNFP